MDSGPRQSGLERITEQIEMSLIGFPDARLSQVGVHIHTHIIHHTHTFHGPERWAHSFATRPFVFQTVPVANVAFADRGLGITVLNAQNYIARILVHPSGCPRNLSRT